MSWIDEIDPKSGSDGLVQVLEQVRRAQGEVDDLTRVQSLNPSALQKHFELYRELMFGESGLSRADREAIAVVVSATNNSPYCVNRHAEALADYERDNSWLKRIMSGMRFLDMPDRAAKMLSFAAKLTASPARIKREDLEALRGVGFSDRDILDIAFVTSYFNFANRMALGLGVKLEPTDDQKAKLPQSRQV